MTMKTTDARKAIKAAYEALTGEEIFVPLDYIVLVHKVRTMQMTPEEAAKSIAMDHSIQAGKQVVSPLLRPPANDAMDFSTYRSAM